MQQKGKLFRTDLKVFQASSVILLDHVSEQGKQHLAKPCFDAFALILPESEFYVLKSIFLHIL